MTTVGPVGHQESLGTFGTSICIIIKTSLAAAKERGLKPLAVIVLDAGGRVKAFQK